MPACRISIVEIVPRIERSVTLELEHAAVDLSHAKFRDHVRVTRSAVSDLGCHHARVRLHFLNRIHVEVGKRRPTHLRISRIETIGRKHGRHAALSIDRKLLREIRRAIRIRHRPSREQKQFAEISGIQRQTGNLRTRQLLASAGLQTHLCDLRGSLEQHFSGSHNLQQYVQPSILDDERNGCLPLFFCRPDRDLVRTSLHALDHKLAIRQSADRILWTAALSVHLHDGARHWSSRVIDHGSIPRRGGK